MDKYWTQGNKIQHVIGKGVTRFHAVYWPAILHSAGLRLPTDILVHGYVTLEGDKISKSAGNTIDPIQARDHRGLEAFRYYLLRHVGSHQDGDFTWQRLESTYETELANQLGNLVSRVLTLSNRHSIKANSQSVIAGDLTDRSLQLVLEYNPQTALREIWQVINTANTYISEQAPWALAKDGNTAKLTAVLAELCATLYQIGKALNPLLPDSSRRILTLLENSDEKITPLFPRRGENTKFH